MSGLDIERGLGSSGCVGWDSDHKNVPFQRKKHHVWWNHSCFVSIRLECRYI